MSSSGNKTNRPTSNKAEKAKPQKKAKQNNSRHEKGWEALRSFLGMADKSKVENLVKTLFEKLRETNGDKSANAIIAPFIKKTIRNKNHRLVDSTWVLDDGGIVEIYNGIQGASFEGETEEHFHCMKLESSDNADTLKYHGTYGWDNESEVSLELKYDPNSDTVEGSILTEGHYEYSDEEELYYVFSGKRGEASFEQWDTT